MYFWEFYNHGQKCCQEGSISLKTTLSLTLYMYQCWIFQGEKKTLTFLAGRTSTLNMGEGQGHKSMVHCICQIILLLKGLGHAILGNFSTDRMVIELTKISK